MQSEGGLPPGLYMRPRLRACPVRCTPSSQSPLLTDCPPHEAQPDSGRQGPWGKPACKSQLPSLPRCDLGRDWSSCAWRGPPCAGPVLICSVTTQTSGCRGSRRICVIPARIRGEKREGDEAEGASGRKAGKGKETDHWTADDIQQ